MILRRLRVSNFKCFADAELPFARVTLVGGQNGSGKSSILDAISLALTGTAKGAETGRSLDELRRTGSKRRWSVELDADLGTLARTEGEGPQSKAQDRIRELLGLGPQQIRACLYSGELLRLPLPDRARLLQDLAPPAMIEVPDWILQLIDEQLHVATLNERVDREHLERLYQAAYTARREAGSEARGAGEALPDVAAPDPQLAQLDLPDLETARTQLARKAADIARERDERASAVRSIEQELQRDTNRAAELRRAMAETWLEVDTEQREAEVIRKTGEARKAKAEIVSRIETLTQDHAAAHAKHQDAEAAVKTLSSLGGTCPHCRQTIDENLRERMVKAAEKAARTTETERSKLAGLLSGEKATLKVSDEALHSLRRTAQALVAEAEAAERAATQRQVDKQALAAIEARMANGHGVEVQRLADELASLTERHARATERLSQLDQYLGHRRAVAQHGAARERLTRTHGDLDRLVKGLDDLRGEAKGGEFATFLDGLTKSLARLGFDGVDLAPLVERESDPIVRSHPARMLSRMQQLLFGVAFQSAAASATGLGLVVVDDADGLDHVTWGAVGELLGASPHQSVVLQALTERDPAAVQRWVERCERANANPDRCYALVQAGVEGSTITVPGRVAIEAAS